MKRKFHRSVLEIHRDANDGALDSRLPRIVKFPAFGNNRDHLAAHVGRPLHHRGKRMLRRVPTHLLQFVVPHGDVQICRQQPGVVALWTQHKHAARAAGNGTTLDELVRVLLEGEL